MSALVKALVAITAIAAVAGLAAGKNYTIQWEVTGSYGDWSAKNPVRVGDTVVFTYGPTHTVDELSEADFAACNFNSPISSEETGSTAVTFDAAGTRYFACKTGSHCRRGQKVAITVADDSAAAAAAPPTGGAQIPPPATPKGNSAARMAAAGLMVRLTLGLGVEGAVLAAF